MTNIRVIIVDDDPAIRQVLRLMVEDLGAMVVAEADNGRAGIEEAELQHPDIMLLDVSMPVMGGFPAARYLREHTPDVRIIVVTEHSQKGYVDEAMELGAKGYVLKTSATADLGPALLAVMEGESFISPAAGGSRSNSRSAC